MPRVLSWIDGRVEELATPEMPCDLAVAVEHVEHRLQARARLAEIFAIVRVARRREQAKMAPTSFIGEVENLRQRRLRNHSEIHARRDVRLCRVELVQKGGARWTGTLV